MWWGIAGALILLPALPLASWSQAPDRGPVWMPTVVAWGIGSAVVVVAVLLAGRLAAGTAWTLSRPRVPPAFLVGGLAVGLCGGAVYAMRALFATNPVSVDEVALLFQAKVFLAGRLAAPVPDPAEAFLVLNTGITSAGWVPQFPPGQAALLALGLLVHAAWLVNPILAGIDTVLVYAVARGLYDARTGLVAALLWAGSAWVIAMSGTYQSHVGAVTFVLLAWAVSWYPRVPRAGHSVLAGLALAAAAATRPLDAVAGALPFLVWAMQRGRVRRLGWSLLGGLPILALWGYLNWRLYGGPFTTGYTAIWGTAHRLGFHPDPWGRAFTPLVALSNLAMGIRRLHLYLEEWPIPALLPLALWGLGSRHRSSSDLVVGVGAAAAPVLYYFYWYSAEFPGPRFYYVAAPMLLIGTARAWRWGWTHARRAARRRAAVRWDVALASGAVIVLGWGWVGLLPRRFRAYREAAPALKLHPERQLRALGVRQALVLVPDSWESRLITQLWALGVRADLAQQAASRLDACDVQHVVLLARTMRFPPAETARRLRALLEATPAPVPAVPNWPDPALRLTRGRTPTADCQVELNRDLRGFTVYGNLPWRNAIGLDSGIVFARDLFERDDRLAARFPGWDVWRYGPPPGEPMALPVLRRVGLMGPARAP